MKNELQKLFPSIRTRKELLDTILSNPGLNNIFSRWSNRQQNEFLDFCSGAKGVKILYDSFFKEVFNPEYSPERLNKLLSVIMGMKVTIIKVLPVDSTRMADETSLVTMDIVVETDDGSIINVEIQKIGYLFPGERSACYSSDLLLRQYKRIRDFHSDFPTNLPSKFSYKEIKPVYTIVFFENSPHYFKDFPNNYIHNFKQCSDTGLELELLQKYIFIPLDIFKKLRHNKPIDNELDAWLTFLSSDNVDDIMELIQKYPEFKSMYDTLYMMCQNIEGVMNMFSKELYELDKNTAELMVDEFSRTIEEQKMLLTEKENIIAKKDDTITDQKAIIAEKDAIISNLMAQIHELNNTNN